MGGLRYTAQFERTAQGWMASLKDEPRVSVRGKSLSTTRASLRYAAGLWAHRDPDTLDLVEEISLPPEVRAVVDDARRRRDRAESATRDARSATDHAVRMLVTDSHLSIRDAADILGISYARVGQLLRETNE